MKQSFFTRKLFHFLKVLLGFTDQLKVHCICFILQSLVADSSSAKQQKNRIVPFTFLFGVVFPPLPLRKNLMELINLSNLSGKYERNNHLT